MSKRPADTKKLFAGGLASFAVLVVIILGIVQAITGQDFGLFEMLEESGLADELISAETGWYRLYFTAPQELLDWKGGLDETLAADIDRAAVSVDVAAYDFDLQRVADALIRAHRRGVKVRMVTDSDNADLDQPQDLESAGIVVVEDERGAIMHNKFVVIDGGVVWTGSWNLTDNGTYRNNNNMIRIVSEELAANYSYEFEEMFLDNQFGPDSPADTPYPRITIDGVEIENYFAPEDGVMSRVIALVSQARRNVRFMAFSFTDDELAAAMLERHAAGVLVEGVFETRGADSEYSEYAKLKKAGVLVWQDGNPAVMHHKVIVIDNKVVVMGSFNFSGNANSSNDENLLVIHDRAIAAEYLDEFERIVEQALP